MTALAAAVACGALAVVAVGVDLVYSIQATVEQRQEDGTWKTVAQGDMSYPRAPFGPGCAAGDLRVTVDNHRPMGATVRVLATHYGASGSSSLLDETWHLEAFEARTQELPALPASAFHTGAPDGSKTTASVEFQVEGVTAWMSVCVSEAPK